MPSRWKNWAASLASTWFEPPRGPGCSTANRLTPPLTHFMAPVSAIPALSVNSLTASMPPARSMAWPASSSLDTVKIGSAISATSAASPAASAAATHQLFAVDAEMNSRFSRQPASCPVSNGTTAMPTLTPGISASMSAPSCSTRSSSAPVAAAAAAGSVAPQPKRTNVSSGDSRSTHTVCAAVGGAIVTRNVLALGSTTARSGRRPSARVVARVWSPRRTWIGSSTAAPPTQPLSSIPASVTRTASSAPAGVAATASRVGIAGVGASPRGIASAPAIEATPASAAHHRSRLIRKLPPLPR